MKILRLLLILPFFAPALAPAALPPPYKIAMQESAQAQQPFVYARVADHGFGVQYWRNDSATAVGQFAGGLIGMALGTVVDEVKSKVPTIRAKEDADKIAALMEHASAQQDLERALAASLASAPLFTAPVEVRELATGEKVAANTFSEDPVLVVELHATLTADYRGLQVTAVAQSLSRAQGATPLYRNRFDYVSDLLPEPHVKTKQEIKSDVAAVKAKYGNGRRKLSKEEDTQYRKELRQASAGTTWDIWRAELLEQWLAGNGSHLREALQKGTAEVARLLAKDLTDSAPAEVRSAEQMRRRLPQAAAGDRYTSVMVGGPFAGSLMSEPEGLNATYCQGVAFRESPTKQPAPKLCP